MSRIGKLPVKIPASVNYTLIENEVTVAGAKGTLKAQMLEGIDIIKMVTFNFKPQE